MNQSFQHHRDSYTVTNLDNVSYQDRTQHQRFDSNSSGGRSEGSSQLEQQRDQFQLNQQQTLYAQNHMQITFHNQSFQHNHNQQMQQMDSTKKNIIKYQLVNASNIVNNDRLRESTESSNIMMITQSNSSLLDSHSQVSLEQTLKNIVNKQKQHQKQHSHRPQNKDDLVMSRTEWFSFLKLVFQELQKLEEQNSSGGDDNEESENEESAIQNMVIKGNLLKIIEFNSNKIPLKTLSEYLGPQDQNNSSKRLSTGSQRKEKCLSYQQVIRCIQQTGNDDSEDILVHWDDIIDNLMLLSTECQNKHHYEGQQKAGSSQQKSQKKEEEEESIEKIVTKIVLKDQSVLLDFSQVKGKLIKKETDIKQIINKTLGNTPAQNIRAITMKQMAISTQHQLSDLNQLTNLVILNLSNLNAQHLDIKQLRLNNLQFLNLSNNNLHEISLQDHNFPRLKELLVSFNRFTTGKFFIKLASLKLLDLSYNLIDQYEDIICLAFIENLVVLNLTNNPINNYEGFDNQSFIEFEYTISKLLPRVMILNPASISRVSCFENFKELAFSVGDIYQQEYDNRQSNSSQKTSKKSILLQSSSSKKDEKSFISHQSTPDKHTNHKIIQRETELKRKKHNLQQDLFSPQEISNDDNMKTPPFKRDQDIPNQIQKTIKVYSDFENSQIFLQNSSFNHETSNTFDSNLHQKFEVPQKIHVKNDHLKYFNQYSKNLDQSSNISESERISLASQKNPYENHMAFVKKEQKPPRYIKIKPTSTATQMSDNSFVDSQIQVSSRTQVQDLRQHHNLLSQSSQLYGGGQIPIVQNISNNNLLQQASQLHQSLIVGNQRHQIKRDMSAQFHPSQIQGGNNLDFSNMRRRDSSLHSVKNKGTSRIINESGIQDDQSDMAQYYERQVSEMNIKKIRDMPSKELCKITNPYTMNLKDQNISPIKAMMIQKPPDDQQRSFQQKSRKPSTAFQRAGSNTNRATVKSSNRSSLAERDKPSTFTPKTIKSMSRNGLIPVQGQSSSQNLSYSNQINIDQKSNKHHQNRTQNVSIRKIMNSEKSQKDQQHAGTELKQDCTFSNQKQNKGVIKYSQSRVAQQSKGIRNSQILEVNANNLKFQQQSPLTRNTAENVRPFQLPTDESNPLNISIPTRSKERKLSNITNNQKQLNLDDQHHDNRSVQAVGSINEHNHNTPRFSQRINQQKEVRYHDAVEIINAKRKKAETKKQLYNSLTGKNQHPKSNRRQPSNQYQNKLNQSGKVQQTKENSSRDRSFQMQNNGYNQDGNQSSQNSCAKLSIDLRMRR